MLTGKSTFFSFLALFGATLCGSGLHADVFNGPTSLTDKSFDTLTINGRAELRNVKAKTLVVYGPLTFNNLEISEKATITGPTIGRHAELHNITVIGPFNVKDVEMNSLDVSGPVSLREFTINGSTVVRGPLFAHDGFFQDLMVDSKEGGEVVEFSDVTVKKDLTICKGSKAETLTLKGDTDVVGNIIFESGEGKIVKEGDGIEVGEIIGAKA